MNDATAPDPLGFGRDASFKPLAVARYLGLTERDLAALAGIAEHLVRYERPLPRAAVAALDELGEILTLVANAMEGSEERTRAWLSDPSAMGTAASPRALLCMGLAQQVRNFVENTMARKA